MQRCLMRTCTGACWRHCHRVDPQERAFYFRHRLWTRRLATGLRRRHCVVQAFQPTATTRSRSQARSKAGGCTEVEGLANKAQILDQIVALAEMPSYLPSSSTKPTMPLGAGLLHPTVAVAAPRGCRPEAGRRRPPERKFGFQDRLAVPSALSPRVKFNAGAV